MKNVLWPIKQEPQQKHVQDQGNPQLFPQACPVLAALQLFDYRQQLVRAVVVVTAGAVGAGCVRWLRWRAGGSIGWNFGDRHPKKRWRNSERRSKTQKCLRPQPTLLFSH